MIRLGAGSNAPLVLSEMDYPDWNALVNGKPAQIRKLDEMLRGIIVPSDESEVTMQYRSVSIYAGVALRAATFGLVLVALFWRKTTTA